MSFFLEIFPSLPAGKIQPFLSCARVTALLVLARAAWGFDSNNEYLN
jgi:hypothetical protein